MAQKLAAADFGEDFSQLAALPESVGLGWMAEGHGRDAWAHTALIAALLANANGGLKRLDER